MPQQPYGIQSPSWLDWAHGPEESMRPEVWQHLRFAMCPALGRFGSVRCPDVSGNRYNGSLQNLPADRHVVGKTAYGRSLEFTSVSNQFITMDLAERSLDLSSLTEFTALAVTQRRTAGSNVVPFANAVTGTNVVNMLQFNDGNVFGRIDDGAAASFGSFSAAGTDTQVIVMRYDGGVAGNTNRLRMWLNNVRRTLSFTGSIPATTSSGAGDLRVGFRTAGNVRSDGFIDLVMFWNKALAASIIESMFPDPFGWLRPAPQPATGSVVQVPPPEIFPENEARALLLP